MTCRQAINRPLPGSNGIYMRDYADRDVKLTGPRRHLEIQLDVPLIIGIAVFILGFLIGGHLMTREERTHIQAALSSLDHAFRQDTFDYHHDGVMDAHRTLKGLMKKDATKQQQSSATVSE